MKKHLVMCLCVILCSVTLMACKGGTDNSYKANSGSEEYSTAIMQTEALEEAYTSLYGNERIGAEDTVEMRKARPLTDKWTFSTNGVSIMGRNGIPCIGFGPGAEAQAHAPNEITWKQDLVTCAAVYALLPSVYCKD